MLPFSVLPFFVIIPVLIAVFLYVCSSVKVARIIAIGLQTAFVGFAFYLFLISRDAEIITNVGNYSGFLGIILRADNLAAVFILLTTVIFLVVGIYTLHDKTSRLYWFLLFILEGALVGLFLTRDFFNVFVLVEVSTIIVAIMLMYDRKRRNMYAGMKFLMVNIVVMQFYLFGLGYIYIMTGVLEMEEAARRLATMDNASLALPYALIMTSIASKCSLLPLLTWLPKVNSIPGSEVSIAAIMSGLHIKSGVYLFIRFQEVFDGMASDMFLIIGIVTAVAGIVLALAQKDIRLILAYSTMAQVSLIIIGLNINDGYSHTGAVFHIINHALFKVALFLGAGMIIRRYKTGDITKMRGLFRLNPKLAAATLLAILGIMGAPLFNGFISKYFLASGAEGVLEWVKIIINLGTILVFVRYAAILFGKPPEDIRATARGLEPDRCKDAAVLALGAVCLALGLFGAQVIEFLFGTPVGVDTRGYIEKLVTFIISLGLGVVIYRYVLAKKDFLRGLKAVDLGFKGICASIGGFFALVLIVIGALY